MGFSLCTPKNHIIAYKSNFLHLVDYKSNSYGQLAFYYPKLMKSVRLSHFKLDKSHSILGVDWDFESH